jgi:hypothetical protein
MVKIFHNGEIAFYHVEIDFTMVKYHGIVGFAMVNFYHGNHQFRT